MYYSLFILKQDQYSFSFKNPSLSLPLSLSLSLSPFLLLFFVILLYTQKFSLLEFYQALVLAEPHKFLCGLIFCSYLHLIDLGQSVMFPTSIISVIMSWQCASVHVS